VREGTVETINEIIFHKRSSHFHMFYNLRMTFDALTRLIVVGVSPPEKTLVNQGESNKQLIGLEPFCLTVSSVTSP